jgi:hypothetical protein
MMSITQPPFHFITLGHDCNVAEMLRSLGMRHHALPFDWVYSSVDSLHQCFTDNFKQFHTGLKLNRDGNGLIDKYGFIYVHDYPSSDLYFDPSKIGEGMLWEYSPVGFDWKTHYPLVKSKYDRRVKRFLSIMRSSEPIVVLCEYSVKDARGLRQILMNVYQKKNMVFINSTTSPNLEEVDNDGVPMIMNRNLGHDTKKWQAAIEDAITTLII